MALSHTILTLLSESAYSGYDLSKLFEDTIGFFWKASHQQIYRELSNMKHLGWVEAEKVPQTGKPDKKLYSITDLGRKELEDWLQFSCTPTPIREDLLVKVLAGAYFPISMLVEQLQTQLVVHQAQLNCYLEKEQAFLQKDNPEDRLKFRYFTLRRGIRYEAEWVDWCQEMLAAITVNPQTTQLYPEKYEHHEN